MATVHTNGGAVSGSNGSTSLNAIPSLDVAAIWEMLGLMKGSLGTIGQQFQTLDEQSAKVDLLGPTKESLRKQAKDLEDEMKSTQDKREKTLQNVRSALKEQLKEKIAKQMKDHIKEQIRQQVPARVEVEVKTRISQHLPVPLTVQVDESRRQIDEVKHAFQNSEARRQNSSLRTYNLDQSLAEVLKLDGKKSTLWPGNLRSLFNYSAAQARDLAHDYGLGGPIGDRERNISHFMAHIGISFPLLWVAVNGSAATNGAGASP
ncbi:uncharacterized protein B0H18DRAFT_526907 [Fomitopsis serialis]|uniref:uncharacterized protein n=1 Tax=Fomitopsis serialis TaxID=139415 RepID=UPI002008D6EF|nr:uncharacterized protein B0H18DRAFT_526907 [Neoantrodia serialis]KAH9922077.1 hypothetical protein B0H18DRAFT_526907 [Neoantrodia serialis]